MGASSNSIDSIATSSDSTSIEAYEQVKNKLGLSNASSYIESQVNSAGGFSFNKASSEVTATVNKAFAGCQRAINAGISVRKF